MTGEKNSTTDAGGSAPRGSIDRLAAGGATVDALRDAIGRRLRHARFEAGLGVRELAARTGLTPGFISQLENGRVMPSIVTLARLCESLHMSISDVFAGYAPKGHLVRRADRALRVTPQGSDEMLSADPTGRLWVLLAHFAAGATIAGSGAARQTDVKCIHVLTGRLTVVLDGEEQVLEAGDSLTFVGLHKHEMKNATTEQVDALIVMTPAPV